MLAEVTENVERSIALFFFFLRSEPGTGARPRLQKMWKVDRTFLFFCGLNLEQVLENVERSIALFFFFTV